MQHGLEKCRPALLGIAVVLVAATLGGCALFFPKKAGVGVGVAGQPGRVEGRIVNERGQPVAGAIARIPEVSQVSAVTGSNGEFTLTGLPAATYYVQVRKEGYLAGAFKVEVTSPEPARFEAQLELTAGNLHNGFATGQVCADCHKLHDPTPSSSYLVTEDDVNTLCFRCHSVGVNRGFDKTIYENSPHGTLHATGSGTIKVWTEQPATNRGYCSTCHEPHGISGPPLMARRGQTVSGRRSYNDLCYTCHEAPGDGHTDGWAGKAAYLDASNKHKDLIDASGRYEKGDCLICHVVHGKTFSGVQDPTMPRLQGNALCTQAGCHLGKATANTGHGKCTLCHDPHDTGASEDAAKVKLPSGGTRLVLTKANGYREDYRNETDLIKNDYCQKCHRPSPPAGYSTAKDPFDPATGFRNSSPAAGQTDPNLHNVHVNRAISGYVAYSGVGHSSGLGVGGDFNKVRCGQCHRVHQTPKTLNLNPTYFTSISRPYSGTYGTWSGNALQSKSGCTVTGSCHTCEWCHTSPGSPASVCWSCSDHSNSGHSGIQY